MGASWLLGLILARSCASLQPSSDNKIEIVIDIRTVVGAMLLPWSLIEAQIFRRQPDLVLAAGPRRTNLGPMWSNKSACGYLSPILYHLVTAFGRSCSNIEPSSDSKIEIVVDIRAVVAAVLLLSSSPLFSPRSFLVEFCSPPGSVRDLFTYLHISCMCSFQWPMRCEAGAFSCGL